MQVETLEFFRALLRGAPQKETRSTEREKLARTYPPCMRGTTITRTAQRVGQILLWRNPLTVLLQLVPSTCPW